MNQMSTTRPATAGAGERFTRLLELQDEFFRDMRPQDKDRMVQQHLAAARSTGKRLEVLCDMTALILSMRSVTGKEESDVRK